MYLAAIVKFAIHRNIVWQANVVMVAAVPIPRDHQLIGFKLYVRIRVNAQWVLKLVIKSSTNIHQYLSEDIWVAYQTVDGTI